MIDFELLPQEFEEVDAPWEIEDRYARLRYMLWHIVMNDEAAMILQDGNLTIFKSKEEGRRIVALWPNETAIRNCDAIVFQDYETITTMTADYIVNDLLPDLYDDEFIALFPSPQLEYEWVDKEMMLNLLDCYSIAKKCEEGTATEADREKLVAYAGLVKRKR